MNGDSMSPRRERYAIAFVRMKWGARPRHLVPLFITERRRVPRRRRHRRSRPCSHRTTTTTRRWRDPPPSRPRPVLRRRRPPSWEGFRPAPEREGSDNHGGNSTCDRTREDIRSRTNDENPTKMRKKEPNPSPSSPPR